MTTTLHRSIVDSTSVINTAAPVVPLWVVVQAVTALNDDETAPEAWSDWIYPVHAIGTIPPMTIGQGHLISGAFLVADPSTGAVAWLKRNNGFFKPGQIQKSIIRVFVVDERPERGQHPCPTKWNCEYDKTEFECDLFC